MSFYLLEIGRARTFVEGDDSNDWESIVCPRVPGHQRAGRRLTSLSLEILSWNVVDFSQTMLGDVVITDHALRIIRGAGLTGFVVKQTKISKSIIYKDNVPSLWELIITAKGGVAHENSGIIKLRECDGCGLLEYSAFDAGIVVDESKYDGSDFFVIAEFPKYVLVNQRTKTILEESKVGNISFVESSKVSWPIGVEKPM